MIFPEKSDVYKVTRRRIGTGDCPSSDEEEVDFMKNDRVEILENGKVVGMGYITAVCAMSVWVKPDDKKGYGEHYTILKRKRNVRRYYGEH